MQTYTIDILNNLIKINYLNVPNTNFIAVNILNVYNPLITSVYQSIYMRTKNLTTLNLVNEG
jgi:hypothetical protein